jgi:hypothetical protein
MRLSTFGNSFLVLCALLIAQGLSVLSDTQVRAQAAKTTTTYSAPYSAMEALYIGQAEQVKAEAMYLQAQAAMLKAQSDSFKARVETMESYQKARAAALDNNLKHAKTYYEKRQLRQMYQRGQMLSRQTANMPAYPLSAAAAAPNQSPAANGPAKTPPTTPASSSGSAPRLLRQLPQRRPRYSAPSRPLPSSTSNRLSVANPR